MIPLAISFTDIRANRWETISLATLLNFVMPWFKKKRNKLFIYTSAFCNTLKNLLFLLQLFLLGRLLPSFRHTGRSDTSESHLPSSIITVTYRLEWSIWRIHTPSAFSLRCWCWSRRLILERGPRPSSSSLCSSPLSFQSSSTAFPRRCNIFCSCVKTF